MRPPLRLREATTIGPAVFLLALSLTGCSRRATEQPQSRPGPAVLATWAEQFAAMEGAVKAKTPDLVLVSGTVVPDHMGPGPTAELVELRGHFSYVGTKPTGTDNEGKPLYPIRMVRFTDHHLATTMTVDPEETAGGVGFPAPPGSGERARLIRLSPQDVLRQTRAEGEAHMGEPVKRGNIRLNLLRTDENPPDVKAPAVWSIEYYGKQRLKFWIDAQTGAVLKRELEGGEQAKPEATASPSPKP